jgi:hypothetical protein
MESMEEMAMTQRVCLRHLQWLDPLVLKVNEAKKVLTVLQDQAVQQVPLELQVQRVQMGQRAQQVLQAVVQLEHKAQQEQQDLQVVVQLERKVQQDQPVRKVQLEQPVRVVRREQLDRPKLQLGL